MKVAVVGGSGFVGRPTVERLLELGAQVSVLRRENARHPREIQISGLDDVTVGHTLRALRPDVVLNLAWTTQHGAFWSSPENGRYLDFAKRLPRLARDAGASRYIGVGSAAEYPSGFRCRSGSRSYLLPPSTYGRAKLQACWSTLQAGLAESMSVAWARIFQVYGPGEPAAKFVSRAVLHFRDGAPLRLEAPNSVLDWIYIDDVAAVLAELCLSERTGVFNIATGMGIEASSVVDVVGSVLQMRSHATRRTDGSGATGESLIACRDESLLRRSDRQLLGIEEGIRAFLNAANTGL